MGKTIEMTIRYCIVYWKQGWGSERGGGFYRRAGLGEEGEFSGSSLEGRLELDEGMGTL